MVLFNKVGKAENTWEQLKRIQKELKTLGGGIELAESVLNQMYKGIKKHFDVEKPQIEDYHYVGSEKLIEIGFLDGRTIGFNTENGKFKSFY